MKKFKLYNGLECSLKELVQEFFKTYDWDYDWDWTLKEGIEDELFRDITNLEKEDKKTIIEAIKEEYDNKIAREREIAKSYFDTKEKCITFIEKCLNEIPSQECDSYFGYIFQLPAEEIYNLIVKSND